METAGRGAHPADQVRSPSYVFSRYPRRTSRSQDEQAGVGDLALVPRIHMYLGLFLAPWMFMYAFSTLVMWWRLGRQWKWGAIAVGAGIFSFLLLVWRL